MARGGEMKIDFQRVALNIRAEMPLAKASRRIGRCQSFLQQIARGQTTKVEFHDGLALLDLHLELCGAEKHRKIRV